MQIKSEAIHVLLITKDGIFDYSFGCKLIISTKITIIGALRFHFRSCLLCEEKPNNIISSFKFLLHISNHLRREQLDFIAEREFSKKHFIGLYSIVYSTVIKDTSSSYYIREKPSIILSPKYLCRQNAKIHLLVHNYCTLNGCLIAYTFVCYNTKSYFDKPPNQNKCLHINEQGTYKNKLTTVTEFLYDFWFSLLITEYSNPTYCTPNRILYGIHKQI
ncbi:hypothetical protein KSF78_0003072 [Schistosoma japonicum]|nr:hypothetical protein KSF78_0003072 [Schistosoma japonicum]